MKNRVSTLGKFSGLRGKKEEVPALQGYLGEDAVGAAGEANGIQETSLEKQPEGGVSWEQVGGGTAGKRYVENTVL